MTDTQRPDDGQTDTVLEIRNASVTFSMDRGTATVLDDVSLELDRHEILGVVGESGSGKSMLAAAMLDVVEEPGQLTGEVTYYPPDDDPIELVSASQKELSNILWEEISMVFQGAMSSFNPTLTIRGHYRETLQAHNKNVQEGMAHARELLSDLYLDPDRVLDAYPHELSGGMSQRALIALSLLLEPNVLVMDEPTAALDLLMQRSIISLIEKLQAKYDLTIVFITHDFSLVADISDRLGVMYAFELVEVGDTETMTTTPAHPYSRALLKAVPYLEGPLDEMSTIEGESPDPVQTPPGCSYSPRCPLATEECTNQDPEMREVEDVEAVPDDHVAACFHTESSQEEIPLKLGADR
jgi:oligopeptide/dipeptide ABC transporter ATP-binding protein